MTREHLFPRTLDELIVPCTEESHFFSEKIPSKYVTGELKVRDVCASCNNGVLSKLDGYLTQWVRKHATRYFSYGESALITYDYDRMLRWLLKFTFNFARVHSDFSGDADLLRRFRGYVLGDSKRPPTLRLSAGLIYSYTPTAEEAATVGGSGPVHPSAIRSSVIWTDFPCRDSFSVRRVSLGAFAFLLVAFEPAARASIVRELGGLLDSRFPGFRILRPENTPLRLKACFESSMDAWRDHVHLQANPYGSFYSSFRQRNRGAEPGRYSGPRDYVSFHAGRARPAADSPT